MRNPSIYADINMARFDDMLAPSAYAHNVKKALIWLMLNGNNPLMLHKINGATFKLLCQGMHIS